MTPYTKQPYRCSVFVFRYRNWGVRMLGWYVMQAKPQKEGFLSSQLTSNQIEAYLPSIKTKSRDGKTMNRSFFPGYIFIQVDLDTRGISDLNWIPGSKGLICFGGQPASVPDHFIQQLRNKLEVLNSKQRSKHCEYRQGDLVTITRGPLEGYRAIFNQYLPDKDRVRLFLDMLSKNTIGLELPAAYIT